MAAVRHCRAAATFSEVVLIFLPVDSSKPTAHKTVRSRRCRFSMPVPVGERLYTASLERRRTLPHDRELARHASDATAKHSRISKPDDRTHIDGVALAMAVGRAEFPPGPMELLGWL